MSQPPSVPLKSAVVCLSTVGLVKEPDIITARKRSRELAELLGFGRQDQIRIATSTSEITRNAIQYAGGGVVEFSFDLEGERPLFVVRVRDRGPGMVEPDAIVDAHCHSQTGMGLGLMGTRRLMDHFSIESTPEQGTTITFGKFLPHGTHTPDPQKIAGLSEQLAQDTSQNALKEPQGSNQELFAALDTICEQELELERRQTELERLNQELEETNRGVVALYAELDDRAAALSRADGMKSRFLSHMSHEFRTPLNSILALCELLIRRVDGDLAAEQEKQVMLMRRSAQELLEMVNDLLDLAKVEAGKVDLHWGRVEIPKLFGALRGMMRPLSTREAVSLIFEDPAEGLILYSDEGKVSQILRNLVANALKFTEHGEVRVSAACRGDHIIFSVSDTGIGIAPEDQESVFQEFSQVEHSIQRKVKGTGLGLPLSRKLAQLLGGTLTVTSVVNLGSTFRLTLPAPLTESVGTPRTKDNHVSPPDPGTEQARNQDAPQDSILVIDDEEVPRYLIRHLFRETGYVVTEAAGGIEGLERARFDQPRLIILDLAMPDRSGFEVLEGLKADPVTAAIPVILHTSRTLESGDLVRLGGRHAAVLPKQVSDREQSFAIIREVLGNPNLLAE
jgi:signal transduction histidine kinase